MQVPSPITVMKGSWHLPTPPAPQAGVPAVGFPPTPTIPSYPPPTIPHHPPVQWPATSTLPPPSAQFITTPPPSLPASHPPPIGYPATSAIPYGAPPWLGPRMPPYLSPPPVRATVSSWSGDPSANSTYGVMPPPQGWPGTAMPATSAEYSAGSHGSYNPPMYSATSATDASSFLPKKDQQLYESSSTKYSSSDRSGCDKTSIEKQRRTDKSTRRKRHRRSRSPISRHRRRSVDGASRRSHSSHRSRDHKKIRERRRSSSDRQRHRKPRSRSLTRDTSSDRLRHHRRTSPSRRRSPRRESYSRQRDRSLSRTHSPVRISRESSKSRVELSSRKKHSERERERDRERDREREKGGQIHSHPTSPEMPEELDVEKELEGETNIWTRCSPADLYYQRSTSNPKLIVATAKLTALHERFKTELLERADRVRKAKPKYEVVQRQQKLRVLKPVHSESSSSSSEDEVSSDDDTAVEELERKRKHPDRLHEELWYNDAGEMNDGPLCRCSARARRSGIRHGIYPGEHHLGVCAPNTNNADRLYHYRITMFPHTNFLTKTPTIIKHDGHEFIFEGFSLFAHYKLDKLPTCKVIRFNIEYTIVYIEESLPENFTINCLELFSSFLFHEVLELVDLNLKAHSDPGGCNRFHLMPRFVRSLEDNGKEILSMNNVLVYLLNSSRLLVEETELANLLKMNQFEWQNFADEVKGMIATYPGMKPCSIRVDQLDRDQVSADVISYPEIVHFGIRPLQLSYAGNPNYQKAWREYVKYRHLLANKPKVLYPDRHKLILKEMRLQEMRTKSNLKRDVTVVVSSQGFCRTGIMCDIVQHAMLIPVLVCHLRFHKSLDILEANIGHCFKDRYLLQLALTHPSYRENFGTNPDHARNSLTNCGIRQPEYGDRRIHYMNTRKRGINTLINIMSRFGKHEETVSNINHNERLEFLGDAVVEFLTSIHLYHLFPDIEEGGLATYRAAIVQNQHLAVLAKKLQLEKYMLYAHGSDLCHDLELRHAMANCLEALMGSLFLDGGIDAADRVFSHTLFSEIDLLDIWINYPHHPLQEQEPEGDRKYIESVPLLQKLTKFEDAIGVQFTHVRLLARAFTHRSVGYNNLTLGSNQRLEFLGDTVLQLVASEYLYKYFPEHHEGHLSLLRSSLVNNRTQAVVCDDLGMVDYAIYAYPKGELKTKDRADLLEAFLGALYVDKGLEFCRVFCQVCFFPRLQVFIMNQDWNDPKSKLQQCCLTLRTMDGGEPDIPVYKVIECKGPTNTRIFTVAVYFRGERLAKGSGHSIQQAEMAAAGKALESSKDRYQVKYSTNPLFVLLNKQSCSHN